MKYFIHLIILISLIFIIVVLNHFYKNDILVGFSYTEDIYTKKFIKTYRASLEQKDDIEYNKEIEEAIKLFLKSYTNLIKKYLYTYSEEDKKTLLKKLETSLEQVISKKNKKAEKIIPIQVIREVLTEVLSVDPHTIWLYSPYYEYLTTSKTIGYHAKFTEDKKNNCMVVISSDEKLTNLQKGDLILAINGIKVEASKDKFAEEVFKQKLNTLTTFTVKRGNVTKDYKVRFESYNQEILHSKVIDNKYLYIKLYQFATDVDSLFFKALKENRVNSLKGIILDLRDNPGGGLIETLIIANFFLSNKALASTENYREQEPKIEKYVSFTETYVNNNIPIVVLINENSASGSEMLSGALALNNRAIIMGDATYGKWTAQEWIVMSKDKVINAITGSIFFIPVNDKQITFQGRGLGPDIKIIANKPSKKIEREEDQKNYLKAKDENYIQREPKLKINENQCPLVINNLTATEKEDRVLGCAQLLLQNGTNIETFAKIFK